MNQQGPRSDSQEEPETSDAQIVEMLSGMNATADLAVVQRTRRAIMLAAAEMREQRKRRRRNTGVVLMTLAVLAMVLTPAIWSSIDDVISGGDFFEAHSMITVLSLMLFMTVLGALLVGLRSERLMSHGRR